MIRIISGYLESMACCCCCYVSPWLLGDGWSLRISHRHSFYRDCLASRDLVLGSEMYWVIEYSPHTIQVTRLDRCVILSFNSLLLNYQNLFTKDLIISVNSIQRPVLMWSFRAFYRSSWLTRLTEMFSTSSPARSEQNNLLCLINFKHCGVDIAIKSY